jgi:hypothetical protein
MKFWFLYVLKNLIFLRFKNLYVVILLCILFIVHEREITFYNHLVLD